VGASLDLQNLLAARSAIIAAMAANPAAPDYNIDGQQVTRSSLYTQLESLNRAISVLQGPVELISEGYC
jgi:hypothetical protein